MWYLSKTLSHVVPASLCSDIAIVWPDSLSIPIYEGVTVPTAVSRNQNSCDQITYHHHSLIPSFRLAAQQQSSRTMTLSPSAALSILIPINIEPTLIPDSPNSLDSLQSIQSDDDNDRQVAEKRLSRYYPETPIKEIGAIVRPQFSCPDFGMGTARTLKGRMKEEPPVPNIPAIHFGNTALPTRSSPTREDGASPSPKPRIRKKNSFVELDAGKRTWEDSFGKEKTTARKRHGMCFSRLQAYLLPLPQPTNFLAC